MVKFLSSNQITASHYHRKDHRVCKINVVNRISSLESGVCCQTNSVLQFWHQCMYNVVITIFGEGAYSQIFRYWKCLLLFSHLRILKCPHKIKVLPLISKSKSTGKDWEDASIRHIFQVLCTSMYITSMSRLENSMPDARPRHDKDSANIKWRMVFK